MKTTKTVERKGVICAVLATFFAIVLAVGLVPNLSSARAYADPTPGGTVTGGDTITEEGEYTITSGSTGTITIATPEEAEVTLVGQGSTGVFNGLSVVVTSSGTKLTIKDFYANQSNTNESSTIDFQVDGTLNIEGTNVIDNDGGLNAAVIHVPIGVNVDFTGTGLLYGYKSALCSYIGGSNGEANGQITFKSGYWHLKGTKTGAVIGGDSTTVKGGDIIIEGGELYVKGVARGALIGGSNQGISGDVFINGGLVELYEDFTGPAIGAGSDANAGYLYVTGGSLKTVESSNSHNNKGESASFKGLPSVSWGAVKALNASDYGLLSVDVSSYSNDATITVTVDGSTWYSGRKYTYVTNEVKNPTAATTEGAICDTASNWLSNDAKWHKTAEDYGTSAYPSTSGAYLAPENNLYLALDKDPHTVTVSDGTTTSDPITYIWDGTKFVNEADCYTWYGDGTATSYTISTASDLIGFANIVNGTATGIAQDSFKDKTVTLAGDIDLTGIANWTPISKAGEKVTLSISSQADLTAAITEHGIVYDNDGCSYVGSERDKEYAAGTTYYYFATAPFQGTFDGQSHAITGLSITSGDDGFVGLFGNNAGTVKNFSLSGTIGVEGAQVGSGSTDNFGAAVGYNSGTITRVDNSATVYACGYAIGGVCGRNAGGTISQCTNSGQIFCAPTYGYRVGGICGHLSTGTVTECVNSANVLGNNYKNGCQGVGGIVGSVGVGSDQSGLDGGTVSYCYNTGAKVTDGLEWTSISGGKQGTGGIVGALSGGNIIACYSLVKDTYAPASSGLVIGKIGSGTYDRMFYCADNATAHSSYGDYTSANEGENGAIIVGGAGIGKAFNTSYTITNSYAKSATYMQSKFFVFTLNGGESKFNLDSGNINNGYPVLAWQGGEAVPAASYVETEATNLQLNNEFTVDIVVKGDSLAAVSGTLTYDTDALTLKSIAKSSTATGNFDSDVTAGTFSLTGNNTATSEGLVVAQATFECKAVSAGASVNVNEVTVGKSGQATSEIDAAIGDALSLPIYYVYTKGDVNNNTKINVIDAQVALDMANSVYSTDYATLLEQLQDAGTTWDKATVTKAADANEDNAITSADARAIQHYWHTQSW